MVSVISVGLNELQTPVAEHFGEVTVFSAGLFAFLVERMKSECPSINQRQSELIFLQRSDSRLR